MAAGSLLHLLDIQFFLSYWNEQFSTKWHIALVTGMVKEQAQDLRQYCISLTCDQSVLQIMYHYLMRMIQKKYFHHEPSAATQSSFNIPSLSRLAEEWAEGGSATHVHVRGVHVREHAARWNKASVA